MIPLAETTRHRLSEFWNEMHFDCHSATAKYGRSETKAAVIKLGPAALGEIANQLEAQFAGAYTDTKQSPDHYWDTFWMWVCLMGSIFEDAGLRSPYDRKTPVLEMDMREWITACRRGARYAFGR